MKPEDYDKRGKAHPTVVRLLECPACHQYGVPPNERGPKFCLKCRWREEEPK